VFRATWTGRRKPPVLRKLYGGSSPGRARHRDPTARRPTVTTGGEVRAAPSNSRASRAPLASGRTASCPAYPSMRDPSRRRFRQARCRLGRRAGPVCALLPPCAGPAIRIASALAFYRGLDTIHHRPGTAPRARAPAPPGEGRAGEHHHISPVPSSMAVGANFH